MTFQEYLNQKDPQRMPTGSVIVTPEDCSSILSYDGNKEVVLDFGDVVFGYTTKVPSHRVDYKDQDKILWTTDQDGNPKVASVFRFVENKK